MTEMAVLKSSDEIKAALEAGESLLKRSALIEAGHFFSMARKALDQLDGSLDVNARKLRLITGLASIERARFGIWTDQSAAFGRQAADLARALGDSETELLALNGLYAHALVRADYPLAETWPAGPMPQPLTGFR